MLLFLYYSSKYDNFILLGDFNLESTELAVRDFCEIFGCKNLINNNTCFKNLLKPCCIDPIITNRPKSFQSHVAVETRLSGFHKMTLTVMKVFYKKKQKWSIITYMIAKILQKSKFLLYVVYSCYIKFCLVIYFIFTLSVLLYIYMYIICFLILLYNPIFI